MRGRHVVCGVEFDTREKVEKEFWRLMETANGNRRSPPRDWIQITSIRMGAQNVVYYEFPADRLR